MSGDLRPLPGVPGISVRFPRDERIDEMTRIFTPTETAAILRAMQDIELGNNGWSFIPADEAVHAGLRAAGYVVLRSTDGHGRPAWRGYTRRAQESLRADRAAGVPVSTDYRVFRQEHAMPDYEGAILARQERETMDW